MWKLMLLCLSYACLADSNLAPFITKCKVDDTKCLKESSAKVVAMFAEGIPDLNVGVMDPMEIKRVDASKPMLKLIVTDIVLTGLKNCDMKKVAIDSADLKMVVKLLCGVKLVGKYDMDGQLLVIPIQGNGGVHADIPKILLNVFVDLEEIDDKEGKKHWKIKSWKHTFQLKEKSNVKFENLFPGNELLRTTTNELISNSGNEVITEIGAPIIKAIVANVVKNVENFFQKVPLEYLVS